MNILPKKNWHVRRKENIAKVKADEAKAAEEEKECKRRLQLAEQEYRTSFLRDKARGVQHTLEGPTSSTHVVPTTTQSQQLNLFNDVEEGRNVKVCNVEYEKEKKEEQEKKEKDIGLLTYLGQSVVDAKGEKQWWDSAPKREPEKISTQNNRVKEEFEGKKKRLHDPLALIKQVGHRMMTMVKERKEAAPSQPILPSEVVNKLPFKIPDDIIIPKDYGTRKRHISDSYSDDETNRRKSRSHDNSQSPKRSKKSHKNSRKRRHSSSDSDDTDSRKRSRKSSSSSRKAKKHRHRSSDSESDDGKSKRHSTSSLLRENDHLISPSVTLPSPVLPASPAVSIEALRRERLERERQERSREVALLCSTYLPEEVEKAAKAAQDRRRKDENRPNQGYNSAFNPELAALAAQRRQARRVTGEQAMRNVMGDSYRAGDRDRASNSNYQRN